MSKGGIFDLPKEAYRNGSYGEELYDSPKESKVFNNSKSMGELTVGVTLQGYEDLKESLNDIESQLDRIIEKQKKINKCNSMSQGMQPHMNAFGTQNPTSPHPNTPNKSFVNFPKFDIEEIANELSKYINKKNKECGIQVLEIRLFIMSGMT